MKEHVGWGGDWVPTESRSKEASGLERHFICSAQEDTVRLCTNVADRSGIKGRGKARCRCGPWAVRSLHKVPFASLKDKNRWQARWLFSLCRLKK